MSAIAPRETSQVSPALLKPIRLVLPYPVSANRYWQSFVPRGQQRAIVVVSKEAKEYKHEVGYLAKQAGLRKPTTKPVSLAFTLHPPETTQRYNGKMELVEVKCGTRMDLDNALKVAIDALKGVAYIDDDQVNEIYARFGEREDRGKLVVEISEFIPAAPPLFAEASA